MPPAIRQLPTNKATRLDNVTCIYCGAADTPDNPLTDEHVVARRFVPRGSFAQGWALIANACEACNNAKAELEDDVSAITLQPEMGEQHTDITLQAEAQRKAKGSFSRRTKKLVKDSHEEQSLSGKIMSSVDVRFGTIAPPQLDPERVRKLAHKHLQGFFYLMSYDEARRMGGFLPGELGFVNSVNRPDWGNPLMLGFANLTRSWPVQLDCVCANGYFKLVVRRETDESPLWSFALEWNAMHRMVGFIGDLERAQAHVDKLPQLPWKQFDAKTRYREEIALDPAEDTLFADRLTPVHGP